MTEVKYYFWKAPTDGLPKDVAGPTWIMPGFGQWVLISDQHQVPFGAIPVASIVNVLETPSAGDEFWFKQVRDAVYWSDRYRRELEELSQEKRRMIDYERNLRRRIDRLTRQREEARNVARELNSFCDELHRRIAMMLLSHQSNDQRPN